LGIAGVTTALTLLWKWLCHRCTRAHPLPSIELGEDRARVAACLEDCRAHPGDRARLVRFFTLTRDYCTRLAIELPADHPEFKALVARSNVAALLE